GGVRCERRVDDRQSPVQVEDSATDAAAGLTSRAAGRDVGRHSAVADGERALVVEDSAAHAGPAAAVPSDPQATAIGGAAARCARAAAAAEAATPTTTGWAPAAAAADDTTSPTTTHVPPAT